MARILVTGGAGFIASHLVDRLIELGNEVVVIDNLSTGKKENLNKGAQLYNLDIRDKSISSVFNKEKPEIVFHYAAQTSVKKALRFPLEDSEINVLGSLNVLEASRGVKKIIFASSLGVYGNSEDLPLTEESPQNPISPYGAGKLATEKYLNCYPELNPTILRHSNVYGPRQDGTGEAGAVAIFLENLLKKKESTIFGGEQTRDFLYVSDAVEAALKAIEAPAGIYNVSTDRETSITKLFEILSQGARPNYAPLLDGEIKRSRASFQKIKRELGFKPEYDLGRGLKETAEWFMHRPVDNSI